MNAGPTSAKVIIEQSTGFDPHRIRMLLYGESGAGKTVHASTWPNPIFLDIDDGMGSINHPVDRIWIQDWETLLDAYYYLRDQDHNYRTIVIDTVNEMQKVSMAYVLENYPARRAYDSQPSVADYGKMIDDVTNVIRAFKSLPFNLVLLTQVKDREFDTDMVQPHLIGKNTARDICRMMDVIGYIYKTDAEDRTRVIAFDAVDFVTKDRSGRLPAMVEMPDINSGYDRLWAYWAP